MLGRFINWCDDQLNPIVVKEVRQSMNGRGIMGTTMLFLTMELAMMVILIMGSGKRITGEGQSMFQILMGILVFACVFGVAVPCSQRFTRECGKDSIDLLHTTTISPYRIISGKLFSCIVSMVYLFSLCVPFMCVAYFMRGISLPLILFYIYMAFIILVPLMTLGILVGCFTLSALIRVLILGGVIWFGWVFVGGWLGFYGWRRMPYFDLGVMISFFATGITGWLYVTAVAGVSHSSSNRLLPVTVYTAVLWLVSLVICIVVMHSSSKSLDVCWLCERWFMPWMMLLSVLCAVSGAGCRLKQTVRVLKRVPRRKVWRLAYFLFSTGAINVFILSFILMSLSVMVVALFSDEATGGLDFYENFVLVPLGFGAYSLFYAGLLIFIRGWLERIFPRLPGFVYLVALLIVFTLLPLAILMLIHLDVYEITKVGAYYFIMSPAVMCYKGSSGIGVVFGLSGFVLTLILNRHYLADYCRDFFYPEEIFKEYR